MLPEMHLLWGKRRGPPFLVFPNCHIPVPFGPCVCPQQHLPAIDQNMGQNIAFLPTQSCLLRKARQLQDLSEIEPWLVRKFQWSRMRKHCQNGFAKPRTLPVVLPLHYWGPMTHTYFTASSFHTFGKWLAKYVVHFPFCLSAGRQRSPPRRSFARVRIGRKTTMHLTHRKTRDNTSMYMLYWFLHCTHAEYVSGQNWLSTSWWSTLQNVSHHGLKSICFWQSNKIRRWL